MNIDNGNASVSADINDIAFLCPRRFRCPCQVATEKIAYDIDIPLAAAPEVQEVHFGMEYLGLGISDTIWAMFDPKDS